MSALLVCTTGWRYLLPAIRSARMCGNSDKNDICKEDLDFGERKG